MSDMPFMKCGHTAMAITGDTKKPCCVICAPNPDAYIVAEKPSLKGRIAKCAYNKSCGGNQPSSVNLAFFEHKPDKDHDEYYCGCHGWD